MNKAIGMKYITLKKTLAKLKMKEKQRNNYTPIRRNCISKKMQRQETQDSVSGVINSDTAGCVIYSMMIAGLAMTSLTSLPSKKTFSFVRQASCENSAELKSFLEQGKFTDINARHPLGWTALQAAATNDKTEILKVLIQLGVDVDAGDEFSNVYQKALEKAVDPLTIMMRREQEFGTTKNVHTTFSGFTALHYAILRDNLASAKLLLEAGANPKLENSSGHPPIEYARSEEMRTLLLTHTAKYEKLSEERKRQERQRFPLKERLRLCIVGQELAIRKVSAAICRKENGWADDQRPLVFLFLGSSGTGKTELAKQLSHYLHQNSTDAMVRVDMSEFQERHEISKLIGPPPGYVGYDDGGQLTERLKKQPNAVVLFDEIDKAHPDVLTILLQLFDEGRLTDGKGKTVECKSAIFILTSNLGSEEIAKEANKLRKGIKIDSSMTKTLATSFEPALNAKEIKVLQDFKERNILPVLKQHFWRDEFIGRINEIVLFLPFTKTELDQLVTKELEFWAGKALQLHQIKLEWVEEVVSVIVETYNPHYGVRSIKQEVEQTIINHLAEAHENGVICQNSKIRIVVRKMPDEEGNLIPTIEFQVKNGYDR